MIGMWNTTLQGLIPGSCMVACPVPQFGADVSGYTSSNKICVLPPPNCATSTPTGACTTCAQGFALNKLNNLCTPNALTPGCLIATPPDATICALCMAGPSPDKQFIINSTGKCNLDCPASNRKTLLPFTTATLIPQWLQDKTLMVASCTPCLAGCLNCETNKNGAEMCSQCVSPKVRDDMGACVDACPLG